MATPKAGTPQVGLDDMSPEQRNEAFEKWYNGQQTKKVSSQAKRGAQALLKAKYPKEYEAFVKQEETRLNKA